MKLYLLICMFSWTICMCTVRKVAAAEGFSIRYFNASHNNPPSAAELQIPEEEDQVYLDGKLKEIFPKGMTGLSDEAKSIAIMQYVSSALTLKNNGGSATKILKEGYAICGGMSHAFRILCRKTGIPSRYIGAFYLRPIQGGHAISEVFYDGQWHLMDPTFALFYYSNPQYDQKGTVASFHEVVLNPKNRTAMKVVEKPWQGTYGTAERSFNPLPAGSDYLKDVYGTGIVDLYVKYATETFPVAYGSADPVSFPVDADLRNNTEFRVGEPDGDSRDVVLQALNGTTYVGGHYLGGSFPPGFHTWTIHTPGRCRVQIIYESTTDTPPQLAFVPLKAVRLATHRYDNRQALFEILTIGTEAIFSIYCPESTFVVDAIKAVRISAE